MTDQNEKKIIDEEKDEFDKILQYVVLHEFAKRLCENYDVTDEYREQLEQKMSDDIYTALREFREVNGYAEPIHYPRRQKILTNRLFRSIYEDFLPFPEVDTPYERFRALRYKKRKITLRVVRVERRPGK